MLTAHSIVPVKPVVYFNFVYIYAGGARSTIQLVDEVRRLTDIKVIDAYGQCREYIASLEQMGVPPIVLFPDWSGRTAVGGTNAVQRLCRMFGSLIAIVQIIVRLRNVLHELKPRAIWVDSEKALFMVWLAAPRDVPVVYFLRAILDSIRWYCAMAWRRVNAVVSVAENNLGYLHSTQYGQGNLHVAYNGINVERTITRAVAEPAGLPATDGTRLRVVLPAVIANPLKGHEVGIRAVGEFIALGGQADLWLCGHAPPEVSHAFYNKMRQLVCDLSIQQYVHFLGWRDDVLSIMARADVVMLPSFREGLPRSLLEAMALAKPVIATRVGGIPELVRNEVDGILVDPGDVEGIVQALGILTDPDVRMRMGISGQRRVREDFSISQQAQKYLSIMNGLTAKRD